MGEAPPKTVVQFTDVHLFADGSKEDEGSIHMIRSVVERVKPDLVVLTGDILDGLQVSATGTSIIDAFSAVVKPLVDNNVPWTFVPGNHDDESVGNQWLRKDLLQVYDLPCCVSKGMSSFTHDIMLGPMHLFLVDSNAYVQASEPVVYDFIHEDQVQWFRQCPSAGEVGLVFFHIPIPEYHSATVLRGCKGEKPCSPLHNSGFFKAARDRGDVHAMFVGHDHWNDFTGVLDYVWLCYGRVSGFSPPSFYSNIANSSRCAQRGGRVIRYDSANGELATWIETADGRDEKSYIARRIQGSSHPLAHQPRTTA
jgi:hypothetical protein